jgi:hypothetical protein
MADGKYTHKKDVYTKHIKSDVIIPWSIQSNNHLPSTFLLFSILSNQRRFKVCRRVRTGCMQILITSRYINELSILRFCYQVKGCKGDKYVECWNVPAICKGFFGSTYLFVLLGFLIGLVFELRTSCCQAGTLLLEPYLQSILLWLFWRWRSHELFEPWLASTCSPPDLSFPNS